MIKANKWKFWLVGNKFRFKIRIKDELPISNLVAVYNHETGKITQYAKPKNSKVVIKPCRGGSGNGVKIATADNYQEILSRYSTNCLVEDFIEQHHFLNDIFSNSLNTLRILTLKNEEKPVVIKAFLKLGRHNTQNMDHFQNGGIYVDIDMKSGILLKGKSNFKYFEDEEYIYHPETGFKFYKKPLPYFEEAKKVAIKAHKLFPTLKIIGWDIAITEKGLCVVEGNRIPDFLMLQIFKPLRSLLSPTLKI